MINLLWPDPLPGPPPFYERVASDPTANDMKHRSLMGTSLRAGRAPIRRDEPRESAHHEAAPSVGLAAHLSRLRIRARAATTAGTSRLLITARNSAVWPSVSITPGSTTNRT
jgi:hypothetical protein